MIKKCTRTGCMMLDTEQEIAYNVYENINNLTTTAVILESSNITEPNSTWSDYGVCDLSAPSEDFLTSTVFQTCVYVMYCIVFVVALLGNGLVCFVVNTSPRMKTVTNYFIVNMAVGDILMTLFCVPFSFVSMLILRYWPFGGVMCKVVNYSQAVSVLVSAYTLLAISIDRYMAIMRPLQPRLGRTAAKLVVAAVWGGALATAAPISVVSQLQRPSEWHRYCQADMCGEQWQRPEQSTQYTYALLGLQFALPLCALVCTYARIARAVWGGRPPGEAQSARDSRMQRSKRKMVKMMVAVVAAFTICWLPLNAFVVLWSLHEQDVSWSTWPGMPYVWFACHWLAMSHTCYNPVIYCYMNARYRRGFRHALSTLLCIRVGKPSRCHRSSMCDGMQLSEMMGVGVIRHGTISSCASRPPRTLACSLCARAPGNNAHGNSVHRNSAHGNSVHGNGAHGNSVHRNSAHGNSAHGNGAHGNSAHGNSARGSTQIMASAPARALSVRSHFH